MAEYEPGVCNIGTRERRKRRILGIASLVGGAAYVVAVIAVDWPAVALLASFVFAFFGVLNLLQASEGFCAGLAMAERYDFSGSGDGEAGSGDGEAGSVHNAAAVRADRLHAGRLTAKALVLALVATLAVYLVGTLV